MLITFFVIVCTLNLLTAFIRSDYIDIHVTLEFINVLVFTRIFDNKHGKNAHFLPNFRCKFLMFVLGYKCLSFIDDFVDDCTMLIDL